MNTKRRTCESLLRSRACPSRWHCNKLSAWCAAPGDRACGQEIQRQSANGASQGIAVHTQFLGGSALIPLVLTQHGQNKRTLEFSQRLLESQPSFVHLRHEQLKLRLHHNLSLLQTLQGHNRSGSEETTENGKGRDIGYALAASSCEEANNVEHAPSRPLM